jgi:hypothetical protein
MNLREREREKSFPGREETLTFSFVRNKSKMLKIMLVFMPFLFYGCRPVDEAFPVINHTQTIIHAQIFTFINIYCLSVSHRERYL